MSPSRSSPTKEFLVKTSLSVPNASSTRQLRSDVRGRVIAPDDADYEEARTRFYAGIERRPAAIVRVANDAEYVKLPRGRRPGSDPRSLSGPVWDRLRAIKVRYDPTNLFRLNQNIPPADGRAAMDVHRSPGSHLGRQTRPRYERGDEDARGF